jgi:serine/threonine protein kinase
MFATGCLLYEMIAGTPPFDGKNFKDVTNAKRENDIKKMNFFSKSRTPCCIDLIERLLDLSPVDRINIEQVLNHPFVKIEPVDYPKYIEADKKLGNELRKQTRMLEQKETFLELRKTDLQQLTEEDIPSEHKRFELAQA